jgi:hypothetical protein
MNNFFDYGSIMIELKTLSRDIHEHLVHKRIEEAAPLAEEFLFQARKLNLWITQEIEHKENKG